MINYIVIVHGIEDSGRTYTITTGEGFENRPTEEQLNVIRKYWTIVHDVKVMGVESQYVWNHDEKRMLDAIKAKSK